MNNISKLCGVLLSLLIPFNTAFSQKNENWRVISFQDFGGNNTDDPRFSSIPLEGSLGSSSLPMKKGGLNVNSQGSYSIGKYPQNVVGSASTPKGWLVAGDHTNQGNKEEGYFLMLNCMDGCQSKDPSKNNYCGNLSNRVDYDKEYIYQCTLSDNICANVKFKFEAYAANMQQVDPSGSSTYASMTLGIYDSNGDRLWGYNNGEGLALPAAEPGSLEYNWQHIEGVFEVPGNIDLSSIQFRVYPSGEVTGAGYDIGLDDITISILQPDVTISATEFEYHKPATLSAKLADDKFFADMGAVDYVWHYSPDGKTNWTQVGGTHAAKGTNFEYKIDSFDKNDQTGNGNGYYRLTIADASILQSVNDQTVCCLRQVFQINETKNKVHMLICDGDKEELDGYTFTKADDGKVMTTANNYEVTTEVIFNTDKYENDTICVYNYYPAGSSDPSNFYTEVNMKGVVLSTAPATPSTRVTYGGHTCDSVTVKGLLIVEDKENLYDTIPGCAGKPISWDNGVTSHTYQDPGPVTIIDSIGCNRYHHKLFIHPNYNIVGDTDVCFGFKYNGKELPVGLNDDLPKVYAKTKYGCDSTYQLVVNVHPKAETVLDTLKFCQSEVGSKDDPVFSFGGKDYNNAGSKIMRVDATKTIENGSQFGCDSVVIQPIVIYPFQLVERDTVICRYQILFGQEWKEKGEYQKDIKTTTDDGCEAVVRYHIKVLSVELKLRSDVKNNNVCEGQAATIVVSLHPADAKQEWEPEIPTTFNNEYKVAPEVSTNYVIHAYSREADCHATDSIYITVSPIPTLVIDTINTMDRYVDFTVTPSPDENNFTYWLGSTANNKSEYDINNNRYFHQMESDGSRLEHLSFGTFVFRVVDEMGCAAEDTLKLEPQPIEPMPVFTPNGDGINDTWIIKNIDAYGSSAYIRIYTRFGKLVYESDRNAGYNNANGFDGTCNGVKLPSTDYWYVIDIEDLDKQYVGHFSLLR